MAEGCHRRIVCGQSQQRRPTLRVLHHDHLRAAQDGTGIECFGLGAVRKGGSEGYP
jgi:hypothetical protein